MLLGSGCQNQSPPKKQEGSSTSDSGAKGNSGKPISLAKKRKAQSAKENQSGPKATVDRPVDFEFVWHQDSGIDFVHTSGIDQRRVFPAANGSGIGVIDFDRDGLEDLCFASGKYFPLEKPDSGHRNQFFRNLGDWKFENASIQSGLDYDGFCTGIAVGDFDNDGFQDIYVGCYGPNVLFRNLGDGSFEEVAGEGVPHGKPLPPKSPADPLPDTPGWATSSAFLDYNNDGNLDIYVGNYGIWNLKLKNNCGKLEEDIRRFCSPSTVRPQADVLYENNGDGTFRDVSENAGIYTYVRGKNQKPVREDFRTQGVIAADFNRDGRIDIYCGNDMHSNLLLVNTAENRFENRTELSSTGYGPNGESLASMGVAAGDADNDGWLDLFCTNFSEEYNSFYKGLGDLQFVEVSKRNRLAEGARAWVGWGTEFIDLDADGWLDVVVTNGHVDPNIQEFESAQEHLQPCLIWKNEKGRFRLARVGGEYFAGKHPGRALAIADLDNDGDHDLIVGHQDQPPAILENVSRLVKPENNLSIRLIGVRANRDGIGARLEFDAHGARLSKELAGGGSYLSSHSTVIRETRWAKKSPARILWPGGSENVLENREISTTRPVIVVESSVKK